MPQKKRNPRRDFSAHSLPSITLLDKEMNQRAGEGSVNGVNVPAAKPANLSDPRTHRAEGENRYLWVVSCSSNFHMCIMEHVCMSV